MSDTSDDCSVLSVFLIFLRLGLTSFGGPIANSVFGWIKASQKTGYGERYFSVDFDQTNHAQVAEAFGIKAFRVEDPAQLDHIIKAAIAFDGPVLIDIISQQLQDTAVPVSQWMG